MKQKVRDVSHQDIIARLDYIIQFLKDMHEEFLLMHKDCGHDYGNYFRHPEQREGSHS